MRHFQIANSSGIVLSLVATSADAAIQQIAALSGRSVDSFQVVTPSVTTFWTKVQEYREWVEKSVAQGKIEVLKDQQFPGLSHDGNLFRRVSDGKVFRHDNGHPNRVHGQINEQVRETQPWGKWVDNPMGEKVLLEKELNQPEGFERDYFGQSATCPWAYYKEGPDQWGRTTSGQDSLYYSIRSLQRAESSVEAIGHFERARPEIDEMISRRALNSDHTGAWDECLLLAGFRDWKDAGDRMNDNSGVRYALILHIGQQSGMHIPGNEPGLFAS